MLEQIPQSIPDTKPIHEQNLQSIEPESKQIRIKKNLFKYEGLADDKIYKGNKEIHCCFCESSSLEPALFKKLGFLYGPYPINHNKGKVYFHEMCVLWSNEIKMQADKSISEFEEVVKKSKNNICYKCGKNGASMVCLKKNCGSVCHFKCVREKDGGLLNYRELGFYCKKKHCKRSEGNKEKKRNKNEKKVSPKSKKIQKK